MKLEQVCLCVVLLIVGSLGWSEEVEKSDVENINTLSESDESLSRLGCDDTKCNRKCKDKGRTGGQCILGRCKCNIRQNQEEVIENADTVSDTLESAEFLTRLGCDDSKCNRKCRDKGRTGGQCILGRCKCNIRQNQDELTESSAPETQ